MILEQSFFLQPAEKVAKQLLGRFLVRCFEDGQSAIVLYAGEWAKKNDGTFCNKILLL